jgi:hypothetical protein
MISLVDRKKLADHSCEYYRVFKQFNVEMGLKS